MYKHNPKRNHSAHNSNGMIASAHTTSQWPNGISSWCLGFFYVVSYVYFLLKLHKSTAQHTVGRHRMAQYSKTMRRSYIVWDSVYYRNKVPLKVYYPLSRMKPEWLCSCCPCMWQFKVSMALIITLT